MEEPVKGEWSAADSAAASDRRRVGGAPPRRFVRRLTGIFLLLVFVAVAFTWISLIPVRRASESWKFGRVAEAVDAADSWSRLRLWPNQYHQILAASHLSTGDSAAAQPHVDAIRGKRLVLDMIPKDELATRLFERRRYDDFLVYDAAVSTLFGGDDAQLHRAVAFLSTGRMAEAETAVRTIDRDDVDGEKLAALERALAVRRQGSYPLVLDRQNRTIAMYEMNNRDLVAINTDFAALVEKEAGAATIEAHLSAFDPNETIETTLDPAVQKAAMAALAGFRGSLVAIDPRTNEILAVASTRGSGALSNLALEQQYEPGSVIKVLTALNALSSGVPLDFPYLCTGELQIDDKRLGDWLSTGHGSLADLDQAMAESCNIVFADLGIRLGAGPLRRFMTAAGFDGSTNLGLFEAPLGRTVGAMPSGYETALYAIGLEHETATTLHLAMLASAMANRGVMTTPRLLRARRSILGDVVGQPPPQTSATLVDKAVAERVIRTMVAVVTREKGTGRRAAPDRMTVAMKTGTAGTREGGFDSVIMGFTPVDAPTLAFALMAEDAGPAEYAGAKITRDFLEGVP
ncbi:MAG TPA: penicillin-binding transpeptidase domain-containing protein [Thermoanaerobaculia bacterium]|nr:penicillin-binding transpeptidase domain-containing protein [Thermoanaerobaculia bacterium]